LAYLQDGYDGLTGALLHIELAGRGLKSLGRDRDGVVSLREINAGLSVGICGCRDLGLPGCSVDLDPRARNDRTRTICDFDCEVGRWRLLSHKCRGEKGEGDGGIAGDEHSNTLALREQADQPAFFSIESILASWRPSSR